MHCIQPLPESKLGADAGALVHRELHHDHQHDDEQRAAVPHPHGLQEVAGAAAADNVTHPVTGLSSDNSDKQCVTTLLGGCAY